MNDYLVSFDKTKIYYQLDLVEKAKAIVVIVHGLSEHVGRYQHVIAFLNQNEYSTIAFDNRGNGHSDGKRGDVKSFHDFLDDLHAVVLLARKYNNKVFLLGHSLGGFIVNAYGAKYNDVYGIISSGAVGVFLKSVTIFRFLPFRPLGFLNIKNGLSNVLSHDPEIEKAYLADPYVLKQNKLRLCGNCFIKGVRYVRKNISSLTVPIIYLHGEDDRIVPKESSEFLYEHVGSTDKTLHIFEGMYHEIFNEVNKTEVLNMVLSWLNKYE